MRCWYCGAECTDKSQCASCFRINPRQLPGELCYRCNKSLAAAPRLDDDDPEVGYCTYCSIEDLEDLIRSKMN